MHLEVTNFGSLIQSYKWHEGGKTFIKPKIVPPFHGHEVTKPHMG